MNIEIWALVLVTIATLIGSFGAILLKKGSGKAKLDLSLITNYHLIFGLFLYALSSILYILALKGGDLSLIYPLVSLSYVWVLFLSNYYLGEEITKNKIIGILLIIFGIIIINL